MKTLVKAAVIGVAAFLLLGVQVNVLRELCKVIFK